MFNNIQNLAIKNLEKINEESWLNFCKSIYNEKKYDFNELEKNNAIIYFNKSKKTFTDFCTDFYNNIKKCERLTDFSETELLLLLLKKIDYELLSLKIPEKQTINKIRKI